MLGFQLLTITFFGAATCIGARVRINVGADDDMPPDLVFRRYFDYIGGWIELHYLQATWPDARLRCQLRGGVLASPETAQLRAALEAARRVRGGGAFIGVHATLSKGDFFSIEGVPLEDLALRWAADNPDNKNNNENCLVLTAAGEAADVDCNSTKPYLCLKRIIKNEELNICGENNNGYLLNMTTNRCYKWHGERRSWARAVAACAAERARLARVFTAEEANTLKHIFEQSIHKSQYGSQFAFIGVHDWSGLGDWQTVQGESVLTAKAEAWNASSVISSSEHFGQCGVLRRGQYGEPVTAASCDFILGFICEKIHLHTPITNAPASP